jgi:hypothetical protein
VWQSQLWKEAHGAVECLLLLTRTKPYTLNSLNCGKKHTGQSESFGLFHPERQEVYLLCPDQTQYQQVLFIVVLLFPVVLIQ